MNAGPLSRASTAVIKTTLLVRTISLQRRSLSCYGANEIAAPLLGHHQRFYSARPVPGRVALAVVIPFESPSQP